jgi:uncharacterized protein YeaO (DUF488 family)
MFMLKRVYDRPAADDGLRVFVERLWPRGVKKEEARFDMWLKEVAPSPELRKWYSHDLSKWTEFQERYRAELKTHDDLLKQLREKSAAGTVTLVYASRDDEHNSANVLKDVLEKSPATNRGTVRSDTSVPHRS